MPLTQDDSAKRSRRHYTSISNYQIVISRGSAGDCCVWCGKVGVPLPDEHNCYPNVSAEEVLGNVRPMFPRAWPEPTMLDHALDLAATGRAVFPCAERPYTAAELGRPAKWDDVQPKAPLLGKGGFHLATMDPDQIKTWWTTWPTAMIGGPVPEDQTVIDLDPYHNGDMAELEKLTGPLPATLTAWSGREDGGRHLYFVNPGGPMVSTGLPEGFDLRAGGKAYCILPPSIHPKTGKPYRWEQAPVATMPDGLAAILRPVKVNYVQPTGLPTQGKLAGILRRMAAERTNRNDLVFWCACVLIEEGYPQGSIDALRDVAIQTGPPSSHLVREVERAIESAEKHVQKGSKVAA